MPTTKNKTNAKPNRKVGAPKGNRNAIARAERAARKQLIDRTSAEVEVV